MRVGNLSRDLLRTLLIVLGVFILLISGCDQESMCGNDVKDPWEDSENCCIDAGCSGIQSCVTNKCVDPQCEDCQYLDGAECKDYECCEDSECDDDSECKNHECKEIECEECQYLEDKECIYYDCCDDSDCSRSQRCKKHECVSVTVNCDDCEYLDDDGLCTAYECCDDDDCSSSKECDDHECVRLECGDCEYISNHQCKDYECCEDSDCDSGEECDNHECSGVTDCIDDDGTCPGSCYPQDDDDCNYKDCNDNIDCLINEAEDCDAVEYEQTYTLEWFGVIQTTTSKNRITGEDDGKCIFYLKMVESHIEYTNETIESMLDDNMTMEEIEAAEQGANDDIDAVEGTHGECKFEVDDLVAMLNRWKDDEWSTSDYDDADCSGDIFDS